MKITVRMDDITPDMDWENFTAFEKMFEAYGILPLLGIVPDNQDPKLAVGKAREDFWDKMKALQKKVTALLCMAVIMFIQPEREALFP